MRRLCAVRKLCAQLQCWLRSTREHRKPWGGCHWRYGLAEAIAGTCSLSEACARSSSVHRIIGAHLTTRNDGVDIIIVCVVVLLIRILNLCLASQIGELGR